MPDYKTQINLHQEEASLCLKQADADCDTIIDRLEKCHDLFQQNQQHDVLHPLRETHVSLMQSLHQFLAGKAVKTQPAERYSQLCNRMIVQYGLPSSGTTVVWQVLNHLFPGCVYKTHLPPSFPVPTIVTQRDTRDVILSRWRKRNNDVTNEKGEILRKISPQELEKELQTILPVIHRYDKYVKANKNSQRLLLLKYEDFINDMRQLLDPIAAFFNLTIPEEEGLRIAEKYSLKANQRISQKFDHFSGYDSTSLIHGKHIFTGEHGAWQSLVEPDCWDDLQRPIACYLESGGYPIVKSV